MYKENKSINHGELMIQWLKKQISSRKTLDSKMYIIVLIIGTFTNLASFIITCVERLAPAAIISTFLCFAAMGVFWYLSVAKDMERYLHLPMMIVIIYILLPMAWFFCGGVKSGMVLYFLGCLFLTVPCLEEGKKRVIMYLVSLLWLSGIIAFSVFFRPDLVTPLSDKEWYLDVLVSIALVSAGIYFITSLIVNAYETERKSKEALLEEMEKLAKVDPLTGLNNRREMFVLLEANEKLNDGQHYLMMLDIDLFKKINDTYGHLFGDRALSTVASILQANAGKGQEEFAARYGGEEFVALLCCKDLAEAEKRAEAVRLQIFEQEYEENPGLHISVSGGMVCIRDYSDLTSALSAADALLYKAKQSGRNRIFMDNGK